MASRFHFLKKNKLLKFYTDIAGLELKSKIDSLLNGQLKTKKKVYEKLQMDRQDPDSELGKLKLF